VTRDEPVGWKTHRDAGVGRELSYLTDQPRGAPAPRPPPTNSECDILFGEETLLVDRT
jgi:hypothetical protein